ncbi:MAG TPA: spore coat protein U domain-containing protein [Allosphingosinicella sp.]|nr:spore coat protein U domain-containing protein [Allosphingosinicella sp.]
MFTTSRTGSLAIGAAFLAAGVAAPGAAVAATASSTMNVTATVTANCTVSTSALAFGNIDTISGGNADSTGGLSIRCTNGTGWSAAAGVGAGSGASFASRRMTSGANLLTYNLYTTAARTTVWGDGTAGTGTLGGTGTGNFQAVTVYGRVGAGQTSVPAGAYADTVTVTVTY